MIVAGGLYLFYKIKTYKPNKDDNGAYDLRLDISVILFIVVGCMIVYKHLT